MVRAATDKIEGVKRSLSIRGWLALLFAFVATALSVPQTRPASGNPRQEFLDKLVAAAIERTNHSVKYVSAYVHLDYPGGEVHEDMVKNWLKYPPKSKWHQEHPDPSIDHRRVPNLMVFFSRQGERLAISSRAEDYSPGDIVTWDLGGDVPHIGMLVNVGSKESGRPLVVHNIGQGPRMEDVLFRWKVTGHFRYFGPPPQGAH
jgi:uncharacterized protein YijF (DUF1287 family)